MDILLVASAFNSLSQRVYAELSDEGHRVDVVLASHGADAVRAAVQEVRPDLVVAPMLKSALPEDVWQQHTCLIVHPGPPGDRGPSSLDWAIAQEAPEWGVTVLQAEAAMDAGDVWADGSFPVPPHGQEQRVPQRGCRRRDSRGPPGRAAIRRRLVQTAPAERARDQRGVAGLLPPGAAADRLGAGQHGDGAAQAARGRLAARRPGRDLRPGGVPARRAPRGPAAGEPGELLATRSGAVCRATRDGAVWIPELRPRKSSGDPSPFRRPAASVLAGFPAPPGSHGMPSSSERPHWLPEIAAPLELPPDRTTWADIRYRQHGPVGFVTFSFPGGAMSTTHCRRLLAAYRYALSRHTSVLVLGGARDFFSNGIHLNVIEASSDPAA